MKLTNKEIKDRIRFFKRTAICLAEENEHIACLKWLFFIEFYKDLLEA